MSFFTNLDNWLIVAAIVGQSMDAGSTHAALNGGRCHEANPLMKNEAVMVGAKTGVTFAFSWGAKKGGPKFKTFSRITLVGLAASGAAAGVHNYYRCIR